MSKPRSPPSRVRTPSVMKAKQKLTDGASICPDCTVETTRRKEWAGLREGLAALTASYSSGLAQRLEVSPPKRPPRNARTDECSLTSSRCWKSPRDLWMNLCLRFRQTTRLHQKPDSDAAKDSNRAHHRSLRRHRI